MIIFEDQRLLSKLLRINSNSTTGYKVFLPMRYFDFGTQMGEPHCYSTFCVRLFDHVIRSVNLSYVQL